MAKKRTPKLAPLEERKKLARKIYRKLDKEYDAYCALNHKSALELLMATILSAQCTDERVNKVTPNLFKRFPNAKAYKKARVEEIEEIVRSTGFFRNKAKNIHGAATRIVDEYGGKVPGTMEDLLTLPGVARKTANVVLGNWFGIASGVVVDTHVKRLTNRMGLTKEQNPVKIEKDLVDLFPEKQWVDLSHLLIWHGRAICDARKPLCSECLLEKLCPQIGVEDKHRTK